MKEVLFIVFCILGNLIGANFLQMPAQVAFLGDKLWIAWGVAFFIAIIFSWILGQLSILIGEVNTLSDYFNDVSMKKTVAYLYWIVVVFANMLFLEIPGLNIGNYSILVAFFMVFSISLINHYFTDKTVDIVDIILSVLKFVLIIAVPLLVYYLKSDLYVLRNYDEIKSVKIFSTGLVCFWSFLGIETVCLYGKGKSVRNSLLIGVFLAFLVYLLVSTIVIGMISLEDISNGEMPFISMLINVGYEKFSKYIKCLSIFMCVGTLYSWISGTAKMALCFAQDNLFSEKFLIKTPGGASLYGLWGSSGITFLAYCLINIPFLKNFLNTSYFLLVVEVCLSMFFVIFMVCSYRLWQISENIFDKLVSLIGMFLLLLILSVSYKISICSVAVFILFYAYQKYSLIY